MRDRYLGLVLAFLAWIVVPGAAARAAEHGARDAGIGAASDSTIDVERSAAPRIDACTSTTTWSAAAEVAAIEGVDAPHVERPISQRVSPARPRGPPSL